MSASNTCHASCFPQIVRNRNRRDQSFHSSNASLHQVQPVPSGDHQSDGRFVRRSHVSRNACHVVEVGATFGKKQACYDIDFRLLHRHRHSASDFWISRWLLGLAFDILFLRWAVFGKFIPSRFHALKIFILFFLCASGAVAYGWSILWFIYIKDKPQNDPRISEDELCYIRSTLRCQYPYMKVVIISDLGEGMIFACTWFGVQDLNER